MPWPQPTDYNAAMQTPAVAFADADLRRGRVATDFLGLPRLHSGNFADVYQIEGDGQAWAVKCFTRPVPGLADRYRALSEHLQEARRPFLVDFTFLDEGIRIKKQWYPVLKMHWVEGFTLNQFLDEHVDQTAVVTRLAQLWPKLGHELHDAKIGHGDLQHGNVLLVPGNQGSSLSLKLIDYDGMWVPQLADCPSGENGHPNYQHPERFRAGHYAPEMDRFSLLAVYTALRAVASSGRELWRKYDTSENLLFREADFREPDRSALFKELFAHPEAAVRALAGHLMLALKCSLEAAPPLDDLVDGDTVRPLSRSEETDVRSVLGMRDESKRRSRMMAAASTGRALDAEERGDTLNAPSEEEPVVRRPSASRPELSPQGRSMSHHDPSKVPPPSAEQRRIAAGQFERANQVVARGDYEYGLKLLFTCCQLEPANLIYRQALRRAEKAKYNNNLRGHWFSWLTTLPAKARLRSALRKGDYLKVLEHGESVLLRNPWDVGTQMRMSEAAEALGLLELAAWSLEQARQKKPKDPVLNRALARLYERRGNFMQASALWEMVRREVPTDTEAMQKVKDLAANDTIQRGQYDAAIGHVGPGRAAPLDETNSSQKTPTSTAMPPVGNERGSRETAPILARIKSDPTSMHNYLQLAAAYRRMNQLDQARAALTDGLGATGEAFELSAELADLEIETFRRDLGVTEEKLKETPDDAELKLLRTRLRKEINSRELDLFRQKADRFPMEMSHRFEVGVRLFRLGQTDEAIKELQAVRTDARFGWRALVQLGHCFLARNNWRLGQRNLEEALQVMPEGEKELRKEVLYLLARGHADSGDYARAVDLGHELAHVDFSYRNIAQLLDEWERKVTKD
jgi:tetratricopeptide (TPR) repeat protein